LAIPVFSPGMGSYRNTPQFLVIFCSLLMSLNPIIRPGRQSHHTLALLLVSPCSGGTSVLGVTNASLSCNGTGLKRFHFFLLFFHLDGEPVSISPFVSCCSSAVFIFRFSLPNFIFIHLPELSPCPQPPVVTGRCSTSCRFSGKFLPFIHLPLSYVPTPFHGLGGTDK